MIFKSARQEPGNTKHGRDEQKSKISVDCDMMASTPAGIGTRQWSLHLSICHDIGWEQGASWGCFLGGEVSTGGGRFHTYAHFGPRPACHGR